jgi:hypothetical protein
MNLPLKSASNQKRGAESSPNIYGEHRNIRLPKKDYDAQV